MKKMYLVAMATTLILTSIGVQGLTVDDPYGQQMIKAGYTEEDIMEISAVLSLSEENTPGLILAQYKKLKDWQLVREYYGVDEEGYENYIYGQKRMQEILNAVPDYIYREMKEAGWTKRDQIDFVNKTNISDIDYEYAWKECKNGKTIDELVEEKVAEGKAKSVLDTVFVMGEMTAEEYTNSFAEIVKADDTTIGEILVEVKILRTDVRNRHKKQSGISDAEIAFCAKQGITNPMDMYRAKYISTANNIPFETVVGIKLKHSDWTAATAEVLDIPLAAYQKQIEELRTE